MNKYLLLVSIILNLLIQVGLIYVPINHPGSSVSHNTLIFSPLDEGEEYKLRPYLNEQAESGWLLGPYVTIAKKFVLTLVELDYEWLKDVYQGEQEFDPKAFAMTLLPILVPFAIGLLLSICVPFVGCWFCYCRLCGKCGGRLTMDKAEEQNTRCGLVNFVVLMFCCVMLTVGAGAIWTVGQRIPNVGDHIVHVANHTVTDVGIFLDNLFRDLKHVAVDDVHFAATHMSGKFDTLPDQILGQFYEETSSQVNSIQTGLTNLGLGTTNLDNGLTSVSTTESDLNTLDATLQGELTIIRNKFDSIKDDCTNHPSAPDCTGFPESGDIPSIDFTISLSSAMNDANSLLTDAQTVDSSALSTAVTDSMTTMENLIKTNTAPVREPATSVLDNITLIVSPLLEEADLAFHNGSDSLDDVRDMINDYTEMMDPYLVKITIAFMVLSGMILLVLIFDVTGVVFGITNCNATSPDRRKFLGHCGGHLIMASVGVSFIWVFLYLLTGVMLMLLGTVLTIICEPVRDLTIYSEFIDDPELWDNEYKLGRMLLDNGSIPLTISGILEDCRNDTAAYTALQIKHRVDIETFVDIEAQLPDLTPMIQQVQTSLSGIELLDASTKTALNNIITSNTGTSVDVNALIGPHIALLSSIDFSTMISNLNTLVGVMDVPLTTGLAVDLRDVILDLTHVHDVTRIALSTKITEMQTNLNTVQTAIDTIMTSLNTVVTQVGNYETYLQAQGANTIEDSTEDFIDDIISLAQQTLSHVQTRLANDIASCTLVWDIYDGATGVLCVYFLDAFNGLWLSLVLVGVFLIPNIWFGVRLTKYFRRPADIREYRMRMHMTADEMNAVVERYQNTPEARKG